MESAISIHLPAILAASSGDAGQLAGWESVLLVLAIFLASVALLAWGVSPGHGGRRLAAGLAFAAATFAYPAVAVSMTADDAEDRLVAATASVHCPPVLAAVGEGRLARLTDRMAEQVMAVCGQAEYLLAASMAASAPR